MDLIELARVPNQSFSVTLEGVRWDITIKQAREVMIVDISRDSIEILRGQRIVAGTPIIPYRYLQEDGNFLLLTDGDELPNWERFEVDQQLIYASAAEIAAIPAEALQWPILAAYQSNQLVINSLIISLGN